MPPSSHSIRAQLDERVRGLRVRIAQARARSSTVNEQDTKRILITPLLEALGWDVYDLDEVRNEYRTKSQDNPVDYAMFLRRSPCLFVEAKALGHSMTDRRWVGQNIGYASVAGVHWCVLTNGDEYRLYNAHAPVDADEKLFRTICLSDESQHAMTVATLELLSKVQMQDKQIDTLWEAHFVDRRVKKALEDLLAGDDSLIRLIVKRNNALTATQVRQALARAEARISFPSAPRVVSASPSPAARGVTDHPAPSVVAPSSAEDGKARSRGQRRTSGRAGRHTTGPASGPPPDAPGRASFADLLNAGLLRAPCRLYANHRRREVEAEVQPDGAIVFEGRRFTSPSLAGAAAVRRPTCNGWTFWRYRDPSDGELHSIDELRARYRSMR